MCLELHNYPSWTKCSNVVITLILFHHKFSCNLLFLLESEKVALTSTTTLFPTTMHCTYKTLYCVFNLFFSPLLVSANSTCKIDNKLTAERNYLNHTGRMSYENRHTSYTDPTSFPALQNPIIQPMPEDPCLLRVRERKHRAAV